MYLIKKQVIHLLPSITLYVKLTENSETQYDLYRQLR